MCAHRFRNENDGINGMVHRGQGVIYLGRKSQAKGQRPVE